jgi:hypothetical protein
MSKPPLNVQHNQTLMQTIMSSENYYIIFSTQSGIPRQHIRDPVEHRTGHFLRTAAYVKSNSLSVTLQTVPPGDDALLKRPCTQIFTVNVMVEIAAALLLIWKVTSSSLCSRTGYHDKITVVVFRSFRYFPELCHYYSSPPSNTHPFNFCS